MNRLVVLLTALTAAAATLVPATAAPALPPDGPGPDTPGTASSVSPATLTPGATLSFTVSGYPAGETVYIKIDDGIGYGDTSVQGSGVWHSQAIPASGTVKGSFALPADIAPGAHWLRFLASKYVDPADPSKGVLGFTRRGGADFTVVASRAGPALTTAGSSSSSLSGGGSSASGLGGTAPEAGAVAGSGAEQVGGQGGVLGITPGAESSASASAAASPESSEDSASSADRPGSDDTAAEVVPDTAGRGGASGGPAMGAVVGPAVLLAAGAGAAWLTLRRRNGPLAPPDPRA
ncbi:MAG: hypothetical protein LBJ02_12315 [Bifidobacteriaceae bacterium]|jgi:hypothetical protein|nr:hypothetical protein [Bifidobacteriaceae bacterium]